MLAERSRQVLLGAALALLSIAAVVAATREQLPAPDATITLTEYVVAAPTTLPAGDNVFRVRNTGHAHHNLTVCPLDQQTGRCDGGPELFDMLQRPEEARDQSFYDDRADMLVLGKRWTSLIRYDLEPGAYRFYCGILGHAQNGMQLEVTVQ